MHKDIEKIFGEEADYLLNHECETISKKELHLPWTDFVERVIADSGRSGYYCPNKQKKT